MEQRDFRMPATGEGWRHCSGLLVTIIGMGHDENYYPVVVFTEYGWSLAQLPGIRTCSIAEFTKQVETGKDAQGQPVIEPRFAFEREAGGDKTCPFINPETVAGFRVVGA